MAGGLVSYLVGAILLIGAAPLMAQNAGMPSAEQLELLRSMSSEDREALMDELGVGGDSRGESDQDRREDSETDRDREDSNRLPRDRDTLNLRDLPRTFKADDTLMIEIGVKKEIPPRVEYPQPNAPPVTTPGVPAPEFEPGEEDRLKDLITRIRARNPYQLDSNGALQLPGFEPIVLAGLTEQQATMRLVNIPLFAKADVKVRPLPVRKTGVAGLKPFGYDLFKDSASTFAPMTDVPVPANYQVGPGDQLTIQLFGSQNRTIRTRVARDGRVSLPDIGPISVSGRTFDQVSAEIEQRVARQMVGVNASVSMGDTRAIRVFVMGDANRPGSYTVSGLAAISSALYAAGGIKPIGSLRDIQLKRRGAVIARLDLYDLLLRGDTGDDVNLVSGDVIFIPPIAATIAVDGEVNRPAIYELRGEATVAQAIQLAGGLTNEADSSRVAVVRVNERRQRVVLDVPLDVPGVKPELVRRGDTLRVLKLRPTLDEGVAVEGHVFRPGVMAWRDGMRLSDAIASIDELKPNADINYILIRREIPPERRIEVKSADLAAALRAPGSASDVILMPRDRLMVFDAASGREELLAPLLADLRRQARIDRPTEVVRIDGRVNSKGDYPLEPGMRVSDLLRAGGGLQEAAYGAKAELTRYRVDENGRSTEVLEVDLAAILRGEKSADVQLWPFDFLNVKEVPEWSDQEQISILGEVRFPGIYPIKRGETLRQVLERAGGLTSLAYPEGSVFTRRELQVREQEQIDRLAVRLQGDLASTALQAAAANQSEAGQALTVGQSLLNQLKATTAVGRLVIEPKNFLPDVKDGPDIALRDGDRLLIPKLRQEVTVIGEVQAPTSHFYRANLSRDDYIGLSGGATRKADRGRIYVVRADGSVVSSENAGWFRSSQQAAMRAGDTVVVPLDTERMPALPMWQSITSIIYNLAIAAAAVNSF